MLVLSRRIGEEIVIDGDIRVRVVGVQGGKVRIGVKAPPAVPVHRKEVFRRRQISGDIKRRPPIRQPLTVERLLPQIQSRHGNTVDPVVSQSNGTRQGADANADPPL